MRKTNQPLVDRELDFLSQKDLEPEPLVLSIGVFMMSVEKLAVGAASACSFVSIIACLLVVPYLYSEVNNLHDLVKENVEAFRSETDQAWTDMMDMQIMVSPRSEPRPNPFNSIFRKKRQTFAGLPSFCQCEPPKLTCPPGPSGPVGAPGRPGQPGRPGPMGQDDREVYAPIQCPAPREGCISCPPGPPGSSGNNGQPGQPGQAGQPGQPGGPGQSGTPGPKGLSGDRGQDGRPGSAGNPGRKGEDGKRGRGRPGKPGLPGSKGVHGNPAGPGQPGRDGNPGNGGPQGHAGFAGQPGQPGSPGQSGQPGIPGKDSHYCPCPRRRLVRSAH